MNERIIVTRKGPVLTITDKTGNGPKSGAAPEAGGSSPSDDGKPKPAHKKGGKPRKPVSPGRAVTRSINKFCQKVQATRNSPKFHICVNIPRVRPQFELPVLEHSLDEFFKEVLLRYSNAYFYRLYDFSVESGLHAHIVARLYSGKKRRELEVELQSIWLHMVGEDKPKLLKVTPYTDATLGYLISPAKHNDRLIVRERIGGKRMWTVINPKAVKEYKEHKLAITSLREHRAFVSIATALIIEAGLPESNISQLDKVNTCLNHLTEDLLREAFKQFKKWRKRHGS